MSRRAAFLDRDGVINVDRGFVSLWDDFEFLPGVIEAMQALQAAGFALIVVTNQSGIARGYYSEAVFHALTDRIHRELEALGVHVTATYHCPHLASGSIEPYAIACDCRKPMPGMLLRAAREWDLDLSRSFIVGDKPSDIDAGVAAGVPVRYFVGHPGVERPIEATGVVTGLLDCARHVLANETAVSA